MNKKSCRVPAPAAPAWFVFALLFVAHANFVEAAISTWDNGGGDGTWNTAANWAPDGVPPATNDVVIDLSAASVLLTNSVTNLSLTLGGTSAGARILVFSNWDTSLTIVSSVTIMTNGVITLPAAFTNNAMSNNVYIVCSNLTVDAGGSINADARGYAGGYGTGGHGRGGGEVASSAGAGGGYGGHGGDGEYQLPKGGSPYGSANMPTEPGSGGGGLYGVAGANGGGAIRINASNTVTVNGTITANGGSCASYSAGGSGGGIYITCNKLTGTNGIIRANGGNGATWYSAGGGGGRIAVIYDQAAQSNVPVPNVTFSTGRGVNSTATRNGDIGTLYFPDNRFLTENITHIGQWLGPAGFTNWSANSLTLSNAWIRFPAEGFQLTVTNNVTIIGNTGRLDLGNTMWTIWYQFSGNISGSTNSTLLNVGGNLTLINGGCLYVYSGMSNASTTNYGALVSVTNDVYLGTNCWIYPFSQTTNGCSPLFRMSNLVIATNAGFNADARGYSGGRNSTAGYGPGGGGVAGNAGVGGGYGGNGGDGGANFPKGGYHYGLADVPLEPGSGGGSRAGTAAGNGGGAIRINASGTVTVNGTLTADGGAGESYSAGGSGGGIYIACNKLIGTNGIVRVNGGDAGSVYDSGGGGGGRIAVIYDQAAQSNEPVPNVTFSAVGGKGFKPSLTTRNGDIGTLYFPDNRFLTENITHIGQWMVPGFTNWSVNNLTLSNGWVRFPGDGFRLTVTNDVTIDGSSGRLELGNILRTNWVQYSGSTNLTVLEVGGNLILTNGGCLHIGSGMTNASTTNYGALVSVTNDILIASASCGIYPYSHYTNGGSALFRMRNLFIVANAEFSAYALGYASGGSSWGYGPGTPSNHYAGAGHGGRGGDGKSYPGGGGSTYDCLNAPVEPGSGGTGGSIPGGSGGALIRIHARDTLTVNGTITANGGNSVESTFGGGSGGGIYITARTFAGTNGIVSANGGNGGSAYGGGGGGGRIGIEYSSCTFTGSVSVAGGTAYNPAKPGTIFLCQSPCLGACSSGCDGMTLGTDFSKDGGDASATNGVRITRTITTWIRRSRLGRSTLAWSDHSTDLDLNQLDNVATFDLSGLPESTGYNIYDNDAPVCTITSDVSGNLSFIVDLTNGAHNILVDHPGAQGAIASFF